MSLKLVKKLNNMDFQYSRVCKMTNSVDPDQTAISDLGLHNFKTIFSVLRS